MKPFGIFLMILITCGFIFAKESEAKQHQSKSSQQTSQQNIPQAQSAGTQGPLLPQGAAGLESAGPAAALPSEEAAYEAAVRELFQDAEAIRDLPGMEGSEVDPMDVIGGGEDTLGKLEEAAGITGTGIPESAVDMPAPTTPDAGLQNVGSGPGRAPVDPVGPAGAMGGAAGQFMRRGWVVDTSRGLALGRGPGEIPGSDTTHYLRSNDGRTRVAVHMDSRGEGTVVGRDEERVDGNGNVTMRTIARGTVTTDIFYDENGNITSKITTDSSKIPTTTPIEGTQDPHAEGDDGAWARWAAGTSGQRPDLNLTGPDQVGPVPEEGADTGPTSGMDPGESIVVNPDVATEAGQAREVSAERRDHWRQQLLEEAGGIVNPPAPDEGT